MVTFPLSKINLGLHVISRQPDGYHSIVTCFYPVPWSDILEIIPAVEMNFHFTGLPIAGGQETNLCVKAYDLLKKTHDLPPVSLHLHKLVPMGAGLGGGSADGAATVGLLNRLFSLQLTTQQMLEYAGQLGSDCAFFNSPSPMIGTGRGDVLDPSAISLSGFHLVIVKPHQVISTQQAYQLIVPKQTVTSLRGVLNQPVTTWKDHLVNDFEEVVFALYPEIGAVKDALYRQGAIYASMSGSGSAVFGLFEREPEFNNAFSGMSVWSGLLP